MAEQVEDYGPRPAAAYVFGFRTSRAVLSPLFRMRWIHTERMPMSGPAIVVANHRSYIDPFALAFMLPTRRPLLFLAKKELFRVPVLGPFLNSAGMLSVDRGTADRGAIRNAVDLLKLGGALGIFPEGTRIRGDKKAEIEVGTAFIASLSGAPVIPCGIDGTERIWPVGRRLPRFPRVTVAVGEAVRPESFAHLPKQERLPAMMEAIVAGIDSAMAEAAAGGGGQR